MLEVEGYRRAFPATGFGQQTSSLLPNHVNGGLSITNSFLPVRANSGRPRWLQEHEREQPTKSPENSNQSDEEDDEDEYRPFTPPPPRERLSYTRYQLELLNGIYNHVRYPNSTQKQLIAKRVGITREQVKIWFQNRRRKDVVNKDKPEKKQDDSDNTDNKSENGDNKSDHGDSDSGVSDTGSTTDEHDKSMVPNVVLKSVLAELNKFEKETFKPKKKTKKKSKAAKQKAMKTNLANTLLHGGFDIINPPNQVVPSAPGNRANKFSHSAKSSAFECPREQSKHSLSYTDFGPMESAVMLRSPTRAYMSHTLGLPSSALGCDMPVLSDLLSTNSENLKDQTDSRLQHTNRNPPSDRHKQSELSPSHHRFTSPYSSPFGYIYPYHFLAEPAFMLSSLRHPDSYRHFGHYPNVLASEPSSFHQMNPSYLSNPYFSSIPPATSLHWNPNISLSSSNTDTSYEQL